MGTSTIYAPVLNISPWTKLLIQITELSQLLFHCCDKTPQARQLIGKNRVYWGATVSESQSPSPLWWEDSSRQGSTVLEPYLRVYISISKHEAEKGNWEWHGLLKIQNLSKLNTS